MAEPVSLRFESTLPASRERVWEWITSVRGISAEMWPVLRMTVPGGIRSIADIPVAAGTPLFRSYVFLFGVLPIDYYQRRRKSRPGHRRIRRRRDGGMAGGG